MSGILQAVMRDFRSYGPDWPVANIGDAYGGGFFAGQINDAGIKYNLVVSPKSSGEISSKSWGTYGTTTGFTSTTNGPANSSGESALGIDYQAAQFCEGLNIGDYSDWYLPAKDELEVLYYYLKPSTVANWTADAVGANANAVSPEPINQNYTSGSPAQTTATGTNGFRTGETNAFESNYYWSSSEQTSTRAWFQLFESGIQDFTHKYSTLYVRAVRRVLA